MSTLRFESVMVLVTVSTILAVIVACVVNCQVNSPYGTDGSPYSSVGDSIYNGAPALASSVYGSNNDDQIAMMSKEEYENSKKQYETIASDSIKENEKKEKNNKNSGSFSFFRRHNQEDDKSDDTDSSYGDYGYGEKPKKAATTESPGILANFQNSMSNAWGSLTKLGSSSRSARQKRDTTNETKDSSADNTKSTPTATNSNSNEKLESTARSSKAPVEPLTSRNARHNSHLVGHEIEGLALKPAPSTGLYGAPSGAGQTPPGSFVYLKVPKSFICGNSGTY